MQFPHVLCCFTGPLESLSMELDSVHVSASRMRDLVWGHLQQRKRLQKLMTKLASTWSGACCPQLSSDHLLLQLLAVHRLQVDVMVNERVACHDQSCQ